MKKFEYWYPVEMIGEGYKYCVETVERVANAARVMHYTYYNCFKNETDAAEFAAKQKDFYNPDKKVEYYKITEG